jgi:hypothetical protein
MPDRHKGRWGLLVFGLFAVFLFCSSSLAGQKPRIKIFGNRVIIDEVYRTVIDLPKNARADRAAARLVKKQLLDFLRRSGYVLANIEANVVRNSIRLDVDEGRLERIVFLGVGTFRTLQLKLDLSLPHHVFNRPYLKRQLRSLARKYDIGDVSYLLVPVEKVKHKGPQIGLGEISGHEMIPSPGSYELRILVGRAGWGTGLDLDLDYDFPDGLTFGVGYKEVDLVFEDDRWSVGGKAGFKLREHLEGGDPFISVSRVVLEGRWYTPSLIGEGFRPFIWLRGDLASQQRADLDTDLYYSSRLEASLNLGYEFVDGFMVFAGGGASERFIFAVDQLDPASIPVEESAQLRPFVLGRVELVFNTSQMRRDRKHKLNLETRYFWHEKNEGFGLSTAQYQKVFEFGWHDFWLKTRGAYLWGDFLFDDEEPVGGRYVRGVFGDKWFVSKVINLVLEFRLSLARDIFKLSLFHDLAVFAERNRTDHSEIARVSNCFGLGFHALVLDLIQLDIYYSVGFASDGDFDHGFSASLKKVF